MLIIFGGLPGTGKTSISKQLAKELQAVYLRIDTVEHALITLTESDLIGPEGYMICYAVAEDNLRLGMTVIADSVNPISITRQDWQRVAKATNKQFIEIELVCSDSDEHKKRVESRLAASKDHSLPTWQDVLDRDYELWETKSLVIDTSKLSIPESVEIILDHIK